MRYFSIKFPFGDDNVGGKFLRPNITSLDDLRSSLYFFLTTNKGERWYDPDFGTDLHKYLFEPNDEITAPQIEKTLREEINKYFKQITIKNIKINQEESNAILLTIDFIFNNTISSLELTVAG